MVQLDQVLVEPLAIRMFVRNLSFDFVIRHNPAFFSIDEEHSAWLQPAFSNGCAAPQSRLESRLQAGLPAPRPLGADGTRGIEFFARCDEPAGVQYSAGA